MLFEFLSMPVQQQFLLLLIPFFLIVLTAKHFVPKKRNDAFIAAASAVFILVVTGLHGAVFLLSVSVLYLFLGKKTAVHRILFTAFYLLHTASTLIFILAGIPANFFYFFFVSFTLPKLAYLAFRRWKGRRMPAFQEYFRFMVFFPVLFHGPILRLETFRKAEKGRVCTARFFLGAAKSAAGWLLLLFFNVSLTGIVFMTSLQVLAAFWVNAISFYLSFSGLMDCVVSIAGFLGYGVPENFPRNPYLCSNVSDFWRNWHATLTKWLTDYVYIPLGGKFNPLSSIVVFFLIGVAHMRWENVFAYPFDSFVMLLLFMLIAVVSLRVSKSAECWLEKSKISAGKKKAFSLLGVFLTFNLACLYWVLLFNLVGSLENLGIFALKILFLA